MQFVHGEAFHQHILDSVFILLFLTCSYGRDRHGSSVNVEVVVAVDTGDFFDDVRFHGYVLGCSPAGNIHGEHIIFQLHAKAQSQQSVYDGVVGDFDTCVTVYKCLVKSKADVIIFECIFVGKCGNHFCAVVDILQQFYKSCDRCHGHFGIQALFVTLGSVSSVAQTNGGLTDGSCIESCGFQSQGSGIFHDLGIQTAHDTCDGNRSVVVADHQSVFVDVTLYAVQSLEGEGLFKTLDADLFYLTGVKCMHGLTHFQHQVVG